MGSSASKPDVQTSYDEKCDTVSSLPAVVSPASPNGSISLDTVSLWEAAASADPKLQLARIILSHSDIRSALASRAARVADPHVFNHAIDFKTGPITDQKSSGRCWLFATTNVIRYNIMKKLNLKDFQLSQVTAVHACPNLANTLWTVLSIFLG
jgi:bleomycin hydrolase